MRLILCFLLLCAYGFAEPTREQVDRLIHASWFGQLKALEELLDQGVGPDIRDGQHQTPLEIAAGYRQRESVRLLLERGADPNFRGRAETALAAACWDGETEIARMLLEAGAEVNPPEHMPPMYTAILSGNLETVNLLLEWKANPNPVPPATIWAAHNFPAGLEALLKAGADPSRSDDAGFTPLTRAVFSGNLEALEVLLKHGVDPDGRDKHGTLMIVLAAELGHRQIFRRLAEVTKHRQQGGVAACGAGWETESLQLLEAFGPEALVSAAAARSGDTSAKLLVSILLRRVSATPEALLAACHSGHTATATLLLNAGAPMEARNPAGQTPLMLACQAGSVELVKELLSRGADRKVKDKDGRTALDLMEAIVQGRQSEIGKLQASRAYQPRLPNLQARLASYQEARTKIAELLHR